MWLRVISKSIFVHENSCIIYWNSTRTFSEQNKSDWATHVGIIKLDGLLSRQNILVNINLLIDRPVHHWFK